MLSRIGIAIAPAIAASARLRWVDEGFTPADDTLPALCKPREGSFSNAP
jgi:hypothetical protein